MRSFLISALVAASATTAMAQAEIQPAPDDAMFSEHEAEPDFGALVELFPDGMPNLLTPQSVASAYKLPADKKPADATKKLPTKIEYADGTWKWDVGTNVTTRTATTAIIPAIPDPFVEGGAAGGNGEIKGQVRYVGKDWEFYGAQAFNTHQGDGTAPTMSETTTIGSLYKLPAELTGGRIGTSLELNSAHERKTRIEYRQPLGWAEGFVTAEQTFLPVKSNLKPPAAVRAGLNRKF